MTYHHHQARLWSTGIVLGTMAVAVQGFNPSVMGLRRRPHQLISSRAGFCKQRTLVSPVVQHQSTYPMEASSFYNNTATDAFTVGENALFDLEEKLRSTRTNGQLFPEAATSEVSSSTHVDDKVQVAKSSSKATTMTSATMNLVKVVLGTGVLALPSGLAAASDYPVALLPASVLLAVLGLFSGYTFYLYGRLTHETQAKNMGELWEKCKGKNSSWIISAGTLSFTFGVALTYSLVIGDFLSSLAMTAFGSGIPALLAKRQFWIVSVTLSTLLPLCNLKSLAALAPMSVLGTVGTILTTLFMAARCPAVVGASPYAALGKYTAAIPAAMAPQFNTFSKIASPASLVIAAMATTAFLGHFNAPDFYHGFKDPNFSEEQQQQQQQSTPTSSSSDVTEAEKKDRKAALSKYSTITKIGFAGVTLLNIAIMAFGFLTFGGNCAGVVLNNYATADRGAAISRLLMTLSVIGGYPFMVGGSKTAILQLYNDLKGKTGENERVTKWATRGLLAALTSLALLLSDAGLVVCLNGALMGSAIIYIFPTLLFLSHTGKQLKAAGGQITRKLKAERFFSRFLLAFGTVSGLLGAAVTIVKGCAPHLLF